MIKKRSTQKPFDGLGNLYSKYEDEVHGAAIFLVQGILFVLTVIVGFVILLATGIFVF